MANMAAERQVRHISVSIRRAAQDVYDFVAAPQNLAAWASGLGQSPALVNGEWVAQTPQGLVRIRFVERNAFGVLDHWVYPAVDNAIYIPMRVIANGDGCELVFTMLRAPRMSDEKFEADAAWVMRDLNALKNLLEG